MTAEDSKAIRTGVRFVLERQDRAVQDFIAQIAAAAPGVDAVKVFNFYKKIRAIKYDGMRYTVKHGALWDEEVLRRADAA
jgi:hypothetical protein